MSSSSLPVLFVEPINGRCLHSIKLLQKAKIDHGLHDISRDPEALAQLLHITGKREVPALIWEDKFITNFESIQLHEFMQVEKSAL